MANTIDILGDDAVTDSIIDGSIIEFVDDQLEGAGDYAFSNSPALTRVILRSTAKVATLSFTSAFSNTDNAIIYVPDALVDDYKAATNWSTYADRIKGLSELPA